MLFNSFTFFIFLLIIFPLYWFFKDKIKIQNLILLVGSYIFYGWWDWRFLSLIAISSFSDYWLAILINESNQNRKRKFYLIISIIINIGILGFFKYFNFFVDSFSILLNSIGLQANPRSLNIILPVGISFYTFQTLSYTIDVYRKDFTPTKNALAFFAFVSFFPQLVAGPIERARNLVPQFLVIRKFSYSKSSDGARQILWGLFKKIVIADNCAIYANDIFNNYTDHSGVTLLFGAILFGFQIYGDFSGYSDIAIGTARLFGFTLMQNFAFPYFSRDIAEFWRRWHISLSTWFRDYIYIPLGGSRTSKVLQFRNVLIIFLVSGFWHGANFTFIAWGGVHALLFIPLLTLKKNRSNVRPIEKNGLNLRNIFSILSTFIIVSLAWIFFRAESMVVAWDYFNILFATLFKSPAKHILFHQQPVFYFLLFLVVIEWFNRTKAHGLSIEGIKQPIRWFIYLFIAYSIFLYGNFSQTEFIYFAF